MEGVLCKVLVGKTTEDFTIMVIMWALQAHSTQERHVVLHLWSFSVDTCSSQQIEKPLFETTLKPMIIFLNCRYAFPHCRVFLFVQNWIVILLSYFSFLLNSNTNCKRSFRMVVPYMQYDYFYIHRPCNHCVGVWKMEKWDGKGGT